MNDFEEYDEFVLLKRSLLNGVVNEGSLFEQFLKAIGLDIEDLS